MQGTRDLIREEQGLFGPGTDLTLSLVAILVILVFALGQLASARSRELVDLQESEERERLDIELVRKNQLKVVGAIAAAYGTTPREMGNDTFGVPTRAGKPPSVFIENDATLQRIRFGSHVLFESDEHRLKSRGKPVLRNVAAILLQQLEGIREVQIQGHADINMTLKYESNLDLAARRAMEVFKFLHAMEIDPTRHLMSATSYGEYYPIARRGRRSYDKDRLDADNRTEEERTLNRRIEIVLHYRRTSRDDALGSTSPAGGVGR